MIIDLIGGSSENQFKDWNAQRTINWYPRITDQKSQEKNKTQIAMLPRPGLVEFTDCSGDSIRGLFTARTLSQERLFAVVNTTLYEIKYDGSCSSIGTLTGMATGSVSKVYMALNGNGQLMIMDTQAAYIFNLTTNALTQITDIDFPNGTTLDFADGYFIISDGNGRVSFSGLNDGTSWGGLDFFTPTYKPDKVKAIVASREEIYCFGDETIEVYINDGETPFIRQSRTSMKYGLTARHSVAVHQIGVFFLGKSASGGSEAYLMGLDYSITPLNIPDFINDATNEDAEGFIVTAKDGQIFYHLHCPALKTTVVYDATNGLWHERQSLRPFPDADGTKPQDMYRGRQHVLFKGMNLYGDWWSGKIFKEDKDVKTDDGEIRILKRISSVFHNELKNVSVYSLEFDINSGHGTITGQGSSPVMMLKYSKDGGNTFDPEEFIELGDIGEYEYRVRTNGLGTARNWVISFEISDPINIIIMQAVVHGTYGAY